MELRSQEDILCPWIGTLPDRWSPYILKYISNISSEKLLSCGIYFGVPG
jgi:hypothetical protein